MFFRLLRKFTSEERVRDCLYKHLVKYPKASSAKISDTTNFKEIGLSTLNIIELLVDVEESLQLNLLDDELDYYETVKETIEAFSKHLNNKPPT